MISASRLSVPAMCLGMMLDACMLCSFKPKNRNKCPAMEDFEFRSLYAQATADVLSQNVAK